jgi:hypothetical protein
MGYQSNTGSRTNQIDNCLQLLLRSGYPTFAKVLATCDAVYFGGDATWIKHKLNSNHREIQIGDFFIPFGDLGISLALRHELAHVVLQHLLRRKQHGCEYDQLANIAADVELSQWYNPEDNQFINRFCPTSCYVGNPKFKKYHSSTFEEIYDDLLKDAKVVTITFDSLGDCKDGEYEELPEELQEVIQGILEDIKKEMVSRTEVTYLRTPRRTGEVKFSKSANALFEIESDYLEIIRPTKKRSFLFENPIYSGTKIIFPSKHKLRRKSATVHVFVDRSGSMDETKTKAAEDVVEKLGHHKGLSLVKHIFSDDIDNSIGGGTNYDGIVQYCKQFEIPNVIVITDNDGNNVSCKFKFNKAHVIGICNTTPQVILQAKVLKTIIV